MTEPLFIYGKHAVFAAIKNPKRKIEEIFLHEDNIELINSIQALLKQIKKKIRLKYVNYKKLGNILSGDIKHQGLVAKSHKLEINNYSSIFTSKKNLRCGVILDRLTDPNNIGAIYRSAKAFGMNFIVNTNKHSVIENSAILNSACGAFDSLQTFTTNNVSNTIKSFISHDWWTIGLDHEANTTIDVIISKMRVRDKLIFVFGSEGKGIRRLIKKNCNFIAGIPNEPYTQSINVSNAAAIVFYEAFKMKNA